MRTEADLHGELGLSEPFTISDFPGTFSEYISTLYWEFRCAVFAADLHFWGKPLAVSGKRASDGKNLVFWHLITSPADTPEARPFSLERAATLPRAWKVLEWLASENPRACWWRPEPSIVKVASLDFAEVVVLRERPGSFRLLSAYPTTPERARVVFTQAAQGWIDGTATPAQGIPCHREEERMHSTMQTLDTWRAA
jgi:hypothetical protein